MKATNVSAMAGLIVVASLLAIPVLIKHGANDSAMTQSVTIADYEVPYYGYPANEQLVLPKEPVSAVDAPYTHMDRDNYSGDSRLEAPYVRMHADPLGGKSLSTPWMHIDNWGGGIHLRSPFFHKDIY